MIDFGGHRLLQLMQKTLDEINSLKDENIRNVETIKALKDALLLHNPKSVDDLQPRTNKE